MDLSAGYCSVRYGIEIRQSALANQLANTAKRLFDLVGRNRALFAAKKQECVDLRAEFGTCCAELEEHCREHSC